METFRIHGDNIVECERIANLIIQTTNPFTVHYSLLSPSTICIDLAFVFNFISYSWRLVLLPGFNKNTKRRWSANIFTPLREAGSYFDETPDAIISMVNSENMEKIILAIEFCSALQAGNQAWQRSARAFSTGRTGCPYLYIVDFVKYELDNTTRTRKNLRFPNAAVPYSYVNYSKTTGNFVAQLYMKSEEFDKTRDPSLADFDEADFGEDILGIYIVKLMLDMDTSIEEDIILEKNMNVVRFLANRFDKSSNFAADEWQDIYNLNGSNIVDFAVNKQRFGFHKTIAAKSHHGASEEFIKIVDQYSVGLASKDLPFGIIPSQSRLDFAKRLSELYPDVEQSNIEAIGQSCKNLIVAIFKGFKPRGDDNRPDRGLLPLAAMLSSPDTEIMSFIYGPLIEANLLLLDSDINKLAESNGLWKSILSLSNYVVLDVPVLGKNCHYDTTRIYNTNQLKSYYNNLGLGEKICASVAFSSVPVSYGEDDVDTGIHYFFTHVLRQFCFEGMCNPPGGDWSGFSIIENVNNGSYIESYENRWLSLPRVSDFVNGKRPDHILELFGVFPCPLLLSIESKERSVDLENDVGNSLVTYIKNLMNYVPSAVRRVSPTPTEWQWGNKIIDFSMFETISAAAYLRKYAEPKETVFQKNCEILFVMAPIMTTNRVGWDIEIIPSTPRSDYLKKFIINNYLASGDIHYTIR